SSCSRVIYCCPSLIPSLIVSSTGDARSVAQLEDTFSVTINDIPMMAQASVTLTLDTGRWRIRFLDIEYMINN
ncbi:MAG: hypothetical protein AAFQ07_20605, partial [Chloroflexota bacterium]